MIVLDTHAWLWSVADPSKLGATARREIARAKKIGVPAICCLEVATLAARGRIRLDRPILDWMDEALALPRVELLPLTPAVAMRAAEITAGFAGDTADRLIAATAALESALLLTKDARLQDAAFVRTAW